jgi:hypothetical protein
MAAVLARRLLRMAEWPLIAALLVVAFVLGFTGFGEFWAAQGAARSGWDRLYLTLQLFTLESGSVSGALPWQLQVARLLAPAVAAYTAVRAIAIIFGEQLERLRIRLRRNHVVISGLGRKGLLLAKSLRERGDQVVLIEEDAENDLIGAARGYGALVLVGDARDLQVLRRAGVRRARHLVALAGDDGANAEIAVQARRLVEGRGWPLSCLVHVVDPQLCELLRMQEIGRADEKPLRLDFFNVFESGARALLSAHPALNVAGEGEPPRAHVVVVGLGQFGEHLVVRAARDWRAAHALAKDGLRVTIIDQRARSLTESVCARHPWLAGVCRLEPREMLIESREFSEARFLFDSGGRVAVSTVYVCLDDDALGLATALALHPHVKAHRVPIVVRMAHGAGLASLLDQGSDRQEFAGLHAFGLLDRMCSPDLLFAGAYEVIARAMHEEYLLEQYRRGVTRKQNPNVVPWEELSEELRESNRDQAAHTGVKLAAVHCDLEPLIDPDAEPVEFDEPGEVELLAEMEHERWRARLERMGWKRGERGLPKRNPHLISWSELDDSVREYDRVFVRGLPRALARAGFRVVRLELPD